jgi:hypothetical protein
VAHSGPSRGPTGGAGNEAGGGFRAGFAAYVAAHVLRGQPFANLDLLPEDAVPLSLALETDAAVDDLEVALPEGTAFVQAKRHLDFRSLKAAVDQWSALARSRDIDPARDRLIAAGASSSGPVKDLASALERYRRDRGGSFSSAEAGALARLKALLSELPEELRERVLSAAVIWIADLTETDGLSARLGQTLLEPAVVEINQGLAAWKALRGEARELASKRYGATLEELMTVLRAANLSLTRDSEGYAAARHEDRRRKLIAYRERVQRKGETLDLRAVGAPLPPLPLGDLDADVDVYEPASDDGTNEASEHNGGLPWALRRRGRALLLGLPGSGKSVALRAAAAHYAARAHWPLPLVVSLDRLARRLESTGFDQALLDTAFEDQPSGDRAALKEAAVELLQSGETAVFLDALDESRAMRFEIVARLQEMMDQVDPAVEVLLSTRDVAYAQAHTLGYKDLRLNPPDRPNDTARAVLGAIADQRHLRGGAAREWIEQRVQWVRDRLNADRELRETPLMVVLLTLLAAEHEADGLPTARATILHTVIKDVVERWEAGLRLHGREAKLGTLSDSDAIRAAQEGFAVIGDAVYTAADPDLSQVHAALATHFAERFGLAVASAEGVADDVRALWDEAGVFVVAGGTERVTARVRLFAELGRALRVAELPPGDQQAWTLQATEEADDRQVLLLASGLNQTVGDALVNRVRQSPSDGDLLQLFGDAMTQGGRFSKVSLGSLAERLLDAPDLESETRWQRARALVDMSLQPEDRTRALAFFDRLDDPRRLVARALAADSWPREDEDVEADLMALLQADPALFEKPALRPLEFHTPDRSYQEAILAAASHLVDRENREVAELVASRAHSVVSMGIGSRLRRILAEAGFAGLMTDIERAQAREEGFASTQRRRASLEELMERDEEAERRLLEIIGALAPAEELGQIECRRLDDLVSLSRTAAWGKAPAGDAAHGILRDGDRLRLVLDATSRLSVLRLGVVAAEAKVLIDECEAEEDRFGPIFMLGDGGRRLEPRAWDRIDNQAELAVELAGAVESPYPWIGHLAALCLAYTPTGARAAAVECLRVSLEEAEAYVQELVAATILGLSRDARLLERFSADPRPMLRRAAARYASQPPAIPILEKLLEDGDAGVRSEAASAVRYAGLADELGSSLETLAEGTVSWQCYRCGVDNDAGEKSCDSCRLSAPSLT